MQSLIIIASILGFLSAKARIPQMKELLQKQPALNRKMILLATGLATIYIAVLWIIPFLSIPFNLTIPLIVLWITGIFFGTKAILGTNIQESKISMGKFVTIYAIATIIFTFAITFIGGRILTRVMFGF